MTRFRTVRAHSVALAGVIALVASLGASAQAQAYVYWVNNNPDAIGRASLDGTGANQAFITGAASPDGVAVDAARVYWANYSSNTIGRASLDGTGANQAFITGASAPRGVAVDAAHVYWANGSGNTNTIGRANLDGTGASQSFITGATSPHGVAVDGSHVYWANYAANTIGRANLDGTGATQSLITGANSPTGVAVDGAHVYWANYGAGTIGRANLDGTGADQSFITGATDPEGVAVDGAHVYWANLGANTIGRANLDGTGANQSFITGASSPYGVAVDALPLSPGSPSPLPGVSDVALSPSVFRAASSGPSALAARTSRSARKRPVGTRVSYSLNEAALVTFTVQHRIEGRKVRSQGRSKCVKPTRKNRHKRRCTRYERLRGSFSQEGKPGPNSLRFTGRLRGRKLKPGRYKLVATPTFNGVKGKPASRGFGIVR